MPNGENYASLHVKKTAEQRYRSAILEIGKTVKIYFTPEEKSAFAQVIEDRWNATRTTTADDHLQWIDVADAAGLLEEEAKMQKDDLLSPSFRERDSAYNRTQAYSRLEKSRMRYLELAQTLDAYANKLGAVEGQSIRLEEAHAYLDAGDERAAVLAYGKVDFHRNGDTGERARYLGLLLKYDPRWFRDICCKSRRFGVCAFSPQLRGAA